MDVTASQFKEIFARVRMNKYSEVYDMLRSGCSADMRDEHGNTPLIISLQNGHKRITKLLLRKGANLDAQNHQGNTPLHYAFKYGYTALGEYLLAKGADDTVRNVRGQTPYETADE